MSTLEPEDIYEYQIRRGRTMSCNFCKHYQGIGEPCNKGITVQNLNDSFKCEYYEHNGELNEK